MFINDEDEVQLLKDQFENDNFLLVPGLLNPISEYLHAIAYVTKHSGNIRQEPENRVIDQSKNNVYSEYAPIIGDALLLILGPLYSQITGKKLAPSYSFYRMYQKGNDLKPHTDRPSCQYSATLQISSTDNKTWSFIADNKKINSTLGDVIFYKGEEVLHGREPLELEESTHIFLHWVDANDPNYESYILDGRKQLGQKK